jgi:ABC-type branched-subunit amino acid transport system ATPase component
MTMSNGLILNNISKRFGDFWALRDVRASVPSGKITAFIGPNGAGKTTLFHVIAGTLRPDTGSVKFGGSDITGLPPYAVAQLGIGRQFQDVRLFGGLSVLENVMIAAMPASVQWACGAWLKRNGNKEAVRQAEVEALRWLEYVGLADKRGCLARELSFGQQKLVSLARLFARGSRFLLLDEPTAGLSHHMVAQITSLIHRAVNEQGLTVALVEHNMSVVADLAFWIHFLHEGRVAFSGENGHVMGNHSVRDIYMGL